MATTKTSKVNSEDIIINKLDKISDNVTKLQIETAQQTATLTSVDARVKALESERVPLDRVKTLEERMREGAAKIVEIEKQSASNTSRYDSINKDIGGINKDITDIKNSQAADKAESKPVRDFVMNAKFILPIFTGIGGVIGAILVAIVLKYLNVK